MSKPILTRTRRTRTRVDAHARDARTHERTSVRPRLHTHAPAPASAHAPAPASAHAPAHAGTRARASTHADARMRDDAEIVARSVVAGRHAQYAREDLIEAVLYLHRRNEDQACVIKSYQNGNENTKSVAALLRPPTRKGGRR